MSLLLRFPIGLALSAAIGVVAYRRAMLTRSGALGAVIVGTAIFGFGGLAWGMLLIAFFVLSSGLSHFREREKEAIAAEKFDKGSVRDIGQALANGGAGALVAALAVLWPTPALLAAFVGAMATVNADTWATELGVLSRRPPRLVTTLRPVERGSSGGVSLLGTAATLAGAGVIGLLAVAFLAVVRALGQPAPGDPGAAQASWLVLAAAGGGLAGSLLDSLFGATVQAIYFCPTCQKETEKRTHSCGTATAPLRGWGWFNNDVVNFTSSLAGAAVAAGLWRLLA